MISWAQQKTLIDLYTSKNGGKLLEIGFGRGEFLKELLVTGWPGKIIGTELSQETVNKTIPELALIGYNKLTLHTATGLTKILSHNTTIDIACAFEVIEHQEKSIIFLHELPGKVLYLSTPNKYRWFPQFRTGLRSYGFMAWFHSWRRLVALPDTYELWDYPPNHLSRYDIPKIKTQLELAGWKLEEALVSPLTSLDIVRAIVPFIRPKKITSNYDERRGSDNITSKLILKVLQFLCIPIATYFKRLGYQGGSLYIKASRK